MLIIDLGLAKLLNTNKFTTVSSDFGDSFVRPPEQDKTGNEIDSRIDIWYLGAILLILFSHNRHILDFNKEYWSMSALPQDEGTEFFE